MLSLDFFGQNSVETKIINLPDSNDPDDFVKNKGAKAFIELINNAKYIIEFHHDYFVKDNNGTISNFINETLNELVLIKEPIFRELSSKKLSDITKVKEENILTTLDNIINKRIRFKSFNDNEDNKILIDKASLLEEDLIRLCMDKSSEIRKFVYDNMNEDWFKSEIHKEIFKQLYIHLKSDEEIPLNLIVNQLSDKIIRSKIVDISINIDKFNPTIQMAKECLIRFETNILKSKLDDLRQKLRVANKDTMISIIENISKIEEDINQLNKKYI